MKNEILIMLFISILIIASCNLQSQPISDNQLPDILNTPKPPYPSKMPIKEVSPTVIPSSLSPTATETITPLISSTPTSWMKLETRCLDVNSDQTNDFKGTGYIFLYGMQGSDHSYYIDMETGTKSPLPDTWLPWEWRISPSEQLLTFQSDNDPNRLAVLSSNGELENAIPWNKDWLYGRITSSGLIDVYQEIDPLYDIYSLMALNAFTGERQEFPVDYPDIYTLGATFFPLSYDPTLSYLIYPYKVEDDIGFRLLNVLTGEIIASIRSIISLSGGPRWSPDGQRALITGEAATLPDYPWTLYEFFIVNLDGTIEQLTDLEAYGASSSWINDGYSWAPDGRYIAFWLKREPDFTEHLAILNVHDRVVTDYCIPREVGDGAYPPVWSPDSQQLVVSDPKLDRPAIVVDIVKEKAAVVGMYLKPESWLTTVPEVWLKDIP